MEDIHADGGQDMAQFQAALEPIVTVMQNMLDKMAAMDEEIDALSKLVNEEIIGGITNLYNSKQRMSGISSLQEKYGSLMGPYKDFYADLTDGHDIFEELYDDLDDLKKQTPEWSDESEASRVNALVDELKARLDKMNAHAKVLGGPAEASEGGEKPATIALSVEKTSAGQGMDADALKEKIRRMKSKVPADGIRF